MRGWLCATPDDLILRSGRRLRLRMDHEKTVDAASCSRGSFCPSSASSLSLSIREGAGKAGWPHAPGAPAQKIFARAREPQVQAVTTGLPCTVGYGLYVISPVNRCLLPPSPSRALRSYPQRLG